METTRGKQTILSESRETAPFIYNGKFFKRIKSEGIINTLRERREYMGLKKFLNKNNNWNVQDRNANKISEKYILECLEYTSSPIAILKLYRRTPVELQQGAKKIILGKDLESIAKEMQMRESSFKESMIALIRCGKRQKAMVEILCICVLEELDKLQAEKPRTTSERHRDVFSLCKEITENRFKGKLSRIRQNFLIIEENLEEVKLIFEDSWLRASMGKKEPLERVATESEILNAQFVQNDVGDRAWVIKFHSTLKGTYESCVKDRKDLVEEIFYNESMEWLVRDCDEVIGKLNGYVTTLEKYAGENIQIMKS